ncbi:sulfite exporter TauE/SafE family protein [Domibacillus sp. DTU_2020_1001157_1_SI_ALB_TIR_016]|uniref:sulfite exporter TauE/SafE family protein n=1 Tax=Domibacillus sp. DTU_2020_1001157_1_SI_ALB_TIR_016 TaxID=3077789 RepID=UPI0028E3778B|nr:sulfite exporter TauE/SafE family protein [Domibacillus sp. DTU_2020_1001157_1_SI_ALB_TIR_016]WNS79186.1 sulfite exporter TauE/SafE family protein [Domibacillus sp. DTU_2020_1001157_1_SI_ALB_TIR_016]
MERFIIFALVGLAAQLVDGALGMGYGLTSTTLLLSAGIAPAVASASVHMAEVVTTAASGISHRKFGNVDKVMLKKLIIPGSIGAFAGATFLSNLTGEYVRLYVSTFLLCLGLFILGRFLLLKNAQKQAPTAPTNRFFIPLGLIGGFFDASGGGGWGPIATPALLSQKGMEPRIAIGTVAASEFAVALSATIGFMISLGPEKINWLWAGAIMLGGIIAAPIAAYIVKSLPTRVLAVIVSGMLIFTNLNAIFKYTDIPGSAQSAVFIALLIIWVPLTVYMVRKEKQIARSEQKRVS